MNPLTSVKGTIIAGFVLSAIIVFAGGMSGFNALNLEVWFHVLAGVIWIGLLYYFNFVQVPGVGAALADSDGPGPAAINKYIAPKALLWFRMAAAVTWLTGLGALQNLQLVPEGASGIHLAFTFAENFELIGLGAWLGTIMLFNVWVLIWPNQKKILGLDGKQHEAAAIAKAKFVALMASRTNTLLSIPMLLCMIGFGHGLTF